MFGRYQVTIQQEPRQLRSTQSYIYYTDDKKGEGATGSVFGGREKKSGERVAVKVFNDVSHQRPGSVQDREFHVVRKLRHRNIVSLLAIEQDSISHDRVIVMELCTGGSLFNVLSKPENSYGLDESEFLTLLGDVSHGMKYLQDTGIVHRDLKPGNIMCCFEADGSSVYKLTDFGAARELADGENFVSIYGTEEYLHPDVYERAVLRKPLTRPFTASVDLWSIGVTLYHAATGVLPFRPYGGRRNRTTMHQMTTLKASGIISGVQRGSENGRIEWSTELPKTVQLSQGLRHHVEMMLAGLLESDVNKMWSSHTFYNTAQLIVEMSAIDVFYVARSTLHKVYIGPTLSFAEFQEYVAIQTSLQAEQQIHVYEGAIFYPECTVPCRSFPETSPSNPIFLFKRDFDGTVSPVAPVAPNVPLAQTKYSLGTDAASTKKSIAAIFCLKRKQMNLLLIQTLQKRVVKEFTQVIRDEARHLGDHLSKLELQKRTLPLSLRNTQELLKTVTLFGGLLKSRANGSRIDVDRICDALEIAGEELGLETEEVEQLSVRFDDVSSLMDDVNRLLGDGAFLKSTWDEQTQCRSKDKCIERFDATFYTVLEIHANFCRDSGVASLPFNAEQVHKMEKIKFNDSLPQLVSLVHDHCEANWRKTHCDMTDWCSRAYSLRAKILQVDQRLTPLVSNFSANTLVVSKIAERCRENIEGAIREITTLCKAPMRLHSETSPEFTKQDKCIGTAHGNPLATGLKLGAAGAGSMDSFFNPKPTNILTVPREFKREIQEWENGKPETLAKFKQSQELHDELKNMSLPDLDVSLDMYGC